MNLIKLDNKITDKNTKHSYLPLYDKLLKPIKEKTKTVLEVGVYFGGSIKLWHDYFTNATIYGCDITDIIKIKEIKNNDRIILSLNKDAYTKSFVDTIKDKKFDFLLDDGPHTLDSMIKFIQFYSPLMSENGILIIEDVKSLKWIDILKRNTPENLKKFIKTYDLRKNKGRYDDIVFTIDKIIR